MTYAANPKRKGKANGKRRIKAKAKARALSVWELYQKDWSQYRIAAELGITQARVSQIMHETFRDMDFDIHNIASHELVKEIERCRIYCEANMARALKDPRTAEVLLKFVAHKSLLLGLAGSSKVTVSGSINHTSDLDFVLFNAEELAVLEFLIQKGSGLDYPKDKRVCLMDSDPVPALTYDRQPVETFDDSADDIKFDGKRSKLQ